MCHSPLYKLRTGWAYHYSVRRPAIESGLPVISHGNEKLGLQKPQAGAETCLLQVAGPVKARAFSSVRWEPCHKDEVDRHLTNTSSIVFEVWKQTDKKDALTSALREDRRSHLTPTCSLFDSSHVSCCIVTGLSVEAWKGPSFRVVRT